MSVEMEAVVIEPSRLTAVEPQGALLKVSLTLKNVSDHPVETQGPPPGETKYIEGETFRARGFTEEKDKFRWGLEYAGRPEDVIDHPYRWGLGSPLQPGETRTLTGYVELHAATPGAGMEYWAGVVCEKSYWAHDRLGVTVVQVTVESPTPDDDDITARLDSIETRLNEVDTRYGQLVNHIQAIILKLAHAAEILK